MPHLKTTPLVFTCSALTLVAVLAMPVLSVGKSSRPPTAAQNIKIDWSPLEDYYSISNVQILVVKERDVLGKFRNVRKLNFIAEAKASIEAPPNFVARLCDSDGIEIRVAPVTFAPREFHWKRGERRRGTIYLPLEDIGVRLIKFVDMTEY